MTAFERARLMKRFVSIFAIVITTIPISENSFAQSNEALEEIATKYKACIKTELEAADNGDGTYDEVFFLEGKEHCDKIQGLQERAAKAEADIAQLTANLIGGAKRELGLK